MRIHILQHTPNEGPGLIQEWALSKGYDTYVYHPYYFNGILPNVEDIDMLVILGGPMSPLDDTSWVIKERELVRILIDRNIPIFGVCYGGQMLSLALGGKIGKSPNKEVGWAPVKLESDKIPGIPEEITALHWHEDMFTIPDDASLLFSSETLINQGFLYRNIIGLQFHFEPTRDGVKEIAINDTEYPIRSNVLNQTYLDIIEYNFPYENKKILYNLLDYISKY